MATRKKNRYAAIIEKIFFSKYTKGDEEITFEREDLERAGIPYIDERGEVLDFHALRHSLISAVETDDISVKMAMARHSDPKLTTRYTHVERRKQAEAVERLPDLTAGLDKVDERRFVRGDDAPEP